MKLALSNSDGERRTSSVNTKRESNSVAPCYLTPFSVPTCFSSMPVKVGNICFDISTPCCAVEDDTDACAKALALINPAWLGIISLFWCFVSLVCESWRLMQGCEFALLARAWKTWIQLAYGRSLKASLECRGSCIWNIWFVTFRGEHKLLKEWMISALIFFFFSNIS